MHPGVKTHQPKSARANTVHPSQPPKEDRQPRDAQPATAGPHDRRQVPGLPAQGRLAKLALSLPSWIPGNPELPRNDSPPNGPAGSTPGRKGGTPSPRSRGCCWRSQPRRPRGAGGVAKRRPGDGARHLRMAQNSRPPGRLNPRPPEAGPKQAGRTRRKCAESRFQADAGAPAPPPPPPPPPPLRQESTLRGLSVALRAAKKAFLQRPGAA